MGWEESPCSGRTRHAILASVLSTRPSAHPTRLAQNPTMRSKTSLLALALLLLLPGTASAQADRTPLSEYRAGLMNSLSAHNSGLRAVLSGEVSQPDHVLHHARGIAAVAEMLVAVWPTGTGGEGTRAAPAIWENGEDFNQKVEVLRAAAARLRQSAEAGDAEGVGAAAREIGQTCRSCHSDYRLRAN